MIYSVLAVLSQGRRPLPSEGKSWVKAFAKKMVLIKKMAKPTQSQYWNKQSK